MRMSDGSSDVCSSDLGPGLLLEPLPGPVIDADDPPPPPRPEQTVRLIGERAAKAILRFKALRSDMVDGGTFADWPLIGLAEIAPTAIRFDPRSEEHTSELQSLMRISYAVFCFKKKKQTNVCTSSQDTTT